jgi:uncharacterized protein involved in exopolysaccharide biosynthesis
MTEISNHSVEPIPKSSVTDEVDQDEISLIDLLVVLAKHKKLILGLPLIAAILATLYSLSLPNIYTAETKILPPQQGQSAASAMLGQLGALGGMAGGLGIKNPNDLYMSMLKSRVVQDNMIRRFDLMRIYESKTLGGARKRLGGVTTIAAGKEGLITIEVDDKDPKLAMVLANGYVEELYRLTQTLAVTEASQKRLFFERQFVQAKDNLVKAEIAARSGLQEGGLVMVDAQGKALVEATARLRGEIAVQGVRIGAMRAFAGEANPDLRLALQQLESLKRELVKIEGDGKVTGKTDSSGAKGMENLHRLRDVKYHETIFELLAKQFEMAKMDEAKEASLIQVLDKAVEPETKSKPKRSLIVIVTALATGFLAVLWAFIREAQEKLKNDPIQSERMGVLKKHLRWRKN